MPTNRAWTSLKVTLSVWMGFQETAKFSTPKSSLQKVQPGALGFLLNAGGHG